MKRCLFLVLAVMLLPGLLFAAGKKEVPLGSEENPIVWSFVPSGEMERVVRRSTGRRGSSHRQNRVSISGPTSPPSTRASSKRSPAIRRKHTWRPWRPSPMSWRPTGESRKPRWSRCETAARPTTARSSRQSSTRINSIADLKGQDVRTARPAFHQRLDHSDDHPACERNRPRDGSKQDRRCRKPRRGGHRGHERRCRCRCHVRGCANQMSRNSTPR